MSFMSGTQPVPSSDEDMLPQDDEHQVDDDVPDRPVKYEYRPGPNGKKVYLEPHTPARKGLKRPFPSRGYDDEIDEEDQPDLEEYFSNWHISPKDVVLICRSYASYVSSAQKATKK